MQAPRKNTLNLAAPATSSRRPRTVGGPAMQAPTSKTFKPRHKNTPNLSYYIVGAGLGSARVCRTLALAFCPAAYTEHPRPCRTHNPAIHPRTVGGPAVQAPTSERRGLSKIISPFCNFIVGASIARPPKPCAAARSLGWSRAPPLPCTARECV